MKVFILFIMLCFMLATFLRGRRLLWNGWILLVVVAGVCFAYFFMNQV